MLRERHEKGKQNNRIQYETGENVIQQINSRQTDHSKLKCQVCSGQIARESRSGEGVVQREAIKLPNGIAYVAWCVQIVAGGEIDHWVVVLPGADHNGTVLNVVGKILNIHVASRVQQAQTHRQINSAVIIDQGQRLRGYIDETVGLGRVYYEQVGQPDGWGGQHNPIYIMFGKVPRESWVFPVQLEQESRGHYGGLLIQADDLIQLEADAHIHFRIGSKSFLVASQNF